MNYELAKQLKDAGFSQTRCDYSRVHSAPGRHLDGSSECAMNPTLSELIEACGDGFERLVRISAAKDWGAIVWQAQGGRQDYEVAQSATPEEGLAKLWLALHDQRH